MTSYAEDYIMHKTVTHTVTTDTVRKWSQDLIAVSTTFSKMADAGPVQDIAYRMERIARIADGTESDRTETKIVKCASCLHITLCYKYEGFFICEKCLEFSERS